MNSPKTVGLFWTAIVVTLHGCSLVVDSQTKCDSNADCKGGATCNQGLCVVYETPPIDIPQIATLQIDGEATAIAGVPYRMEITAKDAEEKLVDPYLGTIGFSSDDPKVTLPANYTFVADDKGTHAFEVTFVTAGKQIVSVIDSEKSNIVGTKEIQINPGSAAKILVTGINNPYTGGTLSNVTLHITDMFENIVTEYSGEVKFTSTDPNATLPKNYIFQPATDKGSHTFTNAIKLTTTGKQSVTALDSKNSSLKGTQENISVTTGTPTKLVFKTQPANVGIGLAISPAIQVEIQDQGNNLVEGEVTISIASGPSGAVLSGTKSKTTSTGTTSFSDLKLDMVGNYILKASYGNISQTSNSFSVNDPCSTNPCVIKSSTCKNTATLTTYSAACTVTGAGAANYKCSSGSTDTTCESGKACHENQCQTASAPESSDLLITEVMHTPSTGNPQWFEIQNLSGKLLDLAGIKIEFIDSASKTYDVPNTLPLLLPANEYFVFGSAAGQTIDHPWGSAISLSNTGELKIISGTTELEKLGLNTDFPTTTPDKSMALSPLATVKRSNGYASAWCVADGSAKSKNPLCTGAADTSAQIANVRETAASTPNMLITNALVTYIKPLVGSETAGFFVQASAKGPALYINIDPEDLGLATALAVGDEISLDIAEKATVEGRVQVSSATLSRSSQSNSVSELAQDVSSENNLVSEIGVYESELISVTGKLTANPAGEGEYLTAKISTTGYTNGDDGLLFRLPSSLQSELNLKTDCEIKLNKIPLWRSEATAFLTAWTGTDLEATCPDEP